MSSLASSDSSLSVIAPVKDMRNNKQPQGLHDLRVLKPFIQAVLLKWADTRGMILKLEITFCDFPTLSQRKLDIITRFKMMKMIGFATCSLDEDEK